MAKKLGTETGTKHGPRLAADIQRSAAARLLGIHLMKGAASSLRLCRRQESSGSHTGQCSCEARQPQGMLNPILWQQGTPLPS